MKNISCRSTFARLKKNGRGHGLEKGPKENDKDKKSVRTERIILDDDMRACYPSFLYKDVIEQALSSLLEKGKIPALPFVKWQIVHEGSSKKLSLLFLRGVRFFGSISAGA